MKKPALAFVIAAVVIAGLAGCRAVTAPATLHSESSAVAAPARRSTLATLPVKGQAPKTGYNRVGDFGTAWTDVDHNSCDTRFPACFELVINAPLQRS